MTSRKGLYAEVEFHDGDRSWDDSYCLAIKVNGRTIAEGPHRGRASRSALARRARAFNKLYATVKDTR